MASAEEKPELKGGHPPAVKAGGMRITQPNKPLHEDGEKMTPEEEAEYGPAKSPSKSDIQLLISGAPAKGNKDFPPEAIQSFHDKPQPTHHKQRDNRPKHVVQQPNKKM
ncbi:death-associated protein 1-like isoform X2 [Apostichopus japonicus]|uniref:death-associated protein 1-like isoform X2 n=1 Tax=Stichopus japonicus TaxID=307972 RepID=UPI003AB20458